MGWWPSEDGTGSIGDRPADVLADLVDEVLGERFDVDLLAGLLAAFGAALCRNPTELVADPPDATAAIRAELSDRPPVVVPIAPGLLVTSVDDLVFDALESVVFQYRDSGPERLPRLAELLETLAFVLRGRIDENDGGGPLSLLRIQPMRLPPIEGDGG